jgi:hypothetical protein
MKPRYALPLVALIWLGALAACSKPASQTAADTTRATTNAAADAGAATANTADAAATSATSAGGAVSQPEANAAINTDANKTSTDVAAASNSFTEGQAKGHIENAGYTDVTKLTKTPDGLWTAKAKKGGKTMDVVLDFKGAVTAK